MPLGFSSGIDNTVEPRKPITSPCDTAPPLSISQHSPTEQNGPSDSINVPAAWVTRPRHRNGNRAESASKNGSSNGCAIVH
jgi:hypothetical protein